jgi:hypothetical protein
MTTPAMLTVFEGRELRGFILPRAKKIPNGKA